MNNKQYALHVQLVGWLLIVGNAVVLLIGLFGLVLLPALGAIANDPAAFRVLSTIGAAGAVFMSVMAVPGLIAGYGLLRRQPWARVLALICAFFDLLNFPIGTAVAVYTFWVLLQADAEQYFSPLKIA